MGSSHRQPDAALACLMLEGAPWSVDLALRAPECSAPAEGARQAIAAAIGGQSGWVEGDLIGAWLRQACEELHEAALIGKAPALAEPLLLLDAAARLRESAQDARGEAPRKPSRSGHEYVFCLSRPEDCLRLDQLREERGLHWSEQRLEEAALALIDAMDTALSRPRTDPATIWFCAPELAARLEIAHGARPALLDFLSRWRDRIQFPRGAPHTFGCSAYEGQTPDQEAFEVPHAPWSWIQSAPSARSRMDFPWGLWLAWSAPTLLESWGERLGARWEADAQLARELSAFEYDRDEWGDSETRSAVDSAVQLERAALARAAGPASQGSSKKSSL